MRQVWIKKVSDKRTNVSVETYMDGVKSGICVLFHDEFRGDLHTAWMAPGV